jgi:hypothetical protein
MAFRKTGIRHRQFECDAVIVDASRLMIPMFVSIGAFARSCTIASSVRTCARRIPDLRYSLSWFLASLHRECVSVPEAA